VNRTHAPFANRTRRGKHARRSVKSRLWALCRECDKYKLQHALDLTRRLTSPTSVESAIVGVCAGIWAPVPLWSVRRGAPRGPRAHACVARNLPKESRRRPSVASPRTHICRLRRPANHSGAKPLTGRHTSCTYEWTGKNQLAGRKQTIKSKQTKSLTKRKRTESTNNYVAGCMMCPRTHQSATVHGTQPSLGRARDCQRTRARG